MRIRILYKGRLIPIKDDQRFFFNSRTMGNSSQVSFQSGLERFRKT